MVIENFEITLSYVAQGKSVTLILFSNKVLI